MPQPFRSAWRKEFDFEYQNDENDETLFVTKSLKLHEYTESRRKERTGYANLLHSSLVKECYRLRITPAQAAEVTAQDYGATGVLPSFTSLPGEAEFEDRVDFQRNEKEMNSLMDLLRKMFKWHPEDRITAEEMLDHEWFDMWCDARLCEDN
jgi:serine/threonine protein kinase